MFSYISNKITNTLVKLTTFVIKNGANTPSKIAIIMDGNRRYAEKNHIKRIQGHEDGMKSLLNIVKWSLIYNVKELTVFAFSVDNFNRSKNEVNDLFDLFRNNFNKFCNSNHAEEMGMRICIYGNWSFFPEDMQKIFSQIEEKTKNYNKIKLNVCVGYNTNEELYHVRTNVDMNKCSNIKDCIKEFESKLYGGYNCNPDLLIRTSGECRLSNFMLYQCRFSRLIFIDKYWPELTFYDFVKILIMYNLYYNNHMSNLKKLEKDYDYPILDKEENNEI